MTRGEGRFVFFNALANGFRTIHPGELPRLVALELRGQTHLPHNDIIDIACGLCRVISDDLGNIPVRSLSENARVGTSDVAVVLDADGRALAEAAKAIEVVPSASQVIVVVNCTDASSVGDKPFSRVVFDLTAQHSILTQALGVLFSRIGRPVDPLAHVRFRHRGFVGLESLGLFDGPATFDSNDEASVELFCHNISEGWQYEGKPVAGGDVHAWLKQLQSHGFIDEARYILAYLRREGFITETQIAEHLAEQYEKLVSLVGRDPIAVVIQPPGKSELKLAYRLKSRVTPIAMSKAMMQARQAGPGCPLGLVCFDDFIGSGKSIRDCIFEPEFNEFASELIKFFEKGSVKLTAIVSHADEKGIRAICDDPRSHGSVAVMAWRIIGASRRAFGSETMVFPSNAKLFKFRDFCQKVGEKIYPAHPLGWVDCQWCIATDYTVPNCSLPILFQHGNKRMAWSALFPRRRARIRREY